VANNGRPERRREDLHHARVLTVITSITRVRKKGKRKERRKGKMRKEL
jgi:hypothetical protein